MDTARTPSFPDRLRHVLMKTPLWVVLSLGGVAGGVLLIWIALNFALANPVLGTKAANWALHAFVDRSAGVVRANLRRPFSSTIDIEGFVWPGHARMRSVAAKVNLFGFLPNTPWTDTLSLKHGEAVIGGPSKTGGGFQPQKLVDRIEADDVTLLVRNRTGEHPVSVLHASGSFSQANVRAEAEAGGAHLTFDGLARSGASLAGRITAKGENLKTLAAVVGASAPDTPPFSITGALHSAARRWEVSGLSGRLGDSDIAGSIGVELTQTRPFLRVALTSASLDFDDLGIVFGIPVGVGRGETTNATQREARATLDRSDRLIPNARVDFARLAAVDADISFDAAKVRDAPAGITSLSIKGDLRDRLLRFQKVRAGFAHGELDAEATLDARVDPVTTKTKGVMRGLSLQQLIKSEYVRGDLSGAFNLTLRGSGFREAFATADGNAGVWSTNSSLARIATEAAGLDVGEVVLDFIQGKKKSNAPLPSRCLAAAATFRGGHGALDPAVLDNSDTLLIGRGGIDLRTERLDIAIRAHPKDISIGSLRGDVRVVGTFRHPGIRVLSVKTLAQAALSSLLAAIAGPLGGLPFVQADTPKDAPCGELLAEAKGVSGKPAPKKKIR